MNESTFWSLIEAAARNNSGAIQDQTEVLKGSLSKLSKKELLSFIVTFWKKMAQAYTWDLLAVPHIAYLECTNSNFEEFRAWLISRGRGTFESALANNKNAAQAVKSYLPNRCIGEECEAFYMLPNDVFKDRFDEDPFDLMNEKDHLENRPPAGNPWHFEQLAIKFPELCSLLGREASNFRPTL